MPGPAPQPISVRVSQRCVLERLIRRQTSPQRQVRRARVVLGAAAGANNEAVGRQVGVGEDMVRLWRRRWAARAEALLAAESEGGEAALEAVIVEVLADEPRAGTPATFSPEQICQILALACEAPPAAGRPIAQWTARELADEAVHRGLVARISPQSVERFLKRSGAAAPSQPLLADTRPRPLPGREDRRRHYRVSGGRGPGGPRGAHPEH